MTDFDSEGHDTDTETNVSGNVSIFPSQVLKVSDHDVAGSLQEAAQWRDPVQQPLPHHWQPGDLWPGGVQGELEGEQLLQYKTTQYLQVRKLETPRPFSLEINPT